MAAEAPKPETTESEKQTNCLGCSKPLKKTMKYYRNGKYYCDKKCWIKAKKPKETEAK
jgi:hypothetical protein